jgi:rhamnosyltransferase
MNVACIITLFNPEWRTLTKLIQIIEPQVDLILLIDNSKDSSHNRTFIKSTPKIRYHYCGGNFGIAYAQNYGVNHVLKKREFSKILFLDQDSLPGFDLVSKLMNSYSELELIGEKVGGVGAFAVNKVSGQPYSKKEARIRQLTPNIFQVSELMSSASLISTSAFKNVGVFEEALFIDGVDYEWCWRASYFNQYKFFVIEDIPFAHSLGEGDKFFLFKKVAISSDFRIYYQFRNFTLLTRRKYVPVSWKLKNLLKYGVKFFYYPLFISPRIKYFKNITRGIKDGLLRENSTNK